MLNTPRAAGRGNNAIIQLIMERAPKVLLNRQDQYGSTPLHFASAMNMMDTVQQLVISCLINSG
jgi:ankyrin repeat protein